MPIKITLLAFCFMLLPISEVVAEITPDERQVIESAIERFHFSEAAKATHLLSDEAYREFYRCNILVYKYFSTQNKLYSDTFENVWKPSIKLIEKLPLKDELRTVLLADLYGKRAAMEFMQENYFTALRMTRTCRKLALRNQENYPDNVEQMKFLGLFNVIFASVPKKYQWLSNLLGYKGDLKLGVSQLNKAAAGSSLLRMETNLVAYYVEKNIMGKPQAAINRIERERKRVGESILLDFLLASTYCSSNRNQEAINILNKRNYYFRISY